MKEYKILYHPNTLTKIKQYRASIISGEQILGSHLKKVSSITDIAKLTDNQFLTLLLNTKKHQIFAESSVIGDGSDWNQKELSLLGDISVAVPVTVFDDARHRNPHIHEEPFRATLLYVPGALLRASFGSIPCDLEAVTKHGEINHRGFYKLYEQRLLPLFQYIDLCAAKRQKKAVITIPGLGCGQFSGKYYGKLGKHLQQVLIDILHNYSDQFSMISLVFYDPYNECELYEEQIGSVRFRVRPLMKSLKQVPQLSQVTEFDEEDDDFSNCDLYSFVAWDHVSWPGNDFYGGSRATDDGVKAAATDSMHKMTGIEGRYNSEVNTYQPPGIYANWESVVIKNKISLQVE